MSVDLASLTAWIGREETAHDVVTAVPLRALAATLDRPSDSVSRPSEGVSNQGAASIDNGVVPPCWHWLYFLPTHPQSELGPDGHARRGGFLPPVPLPRRMWAGSCIDFMRPLRVGDALTRRSRIDDVRLKEGRSGPLVFVKVRHEIHANGALAIVDTHDIVYRDVTPNDAATPAAQASFSSTPDVAATGAAGDATWTRRIVPDDVLLFRYSALTFNGHRIHYDRRYVTEAEGYPGLIVHGPLIATLLLELVWQHRPEARVTHFSFKAVKPIFDLAPFDVCGRALDAQHLELWALAPDGAVAMQAQATLA